MSLYHYQSRVEDSLENEPSSSVFAKGDCSSDPFHNLCRGCEHDHISASNLAVVTEALRVQQKIITGFPGPCFAIISGILFDVSVVLE